MVEQIQEIKGYELKSILGEGGFGSVYLAYQSLIKREVAVKVIRARYANQPEFIRRFEAEAQLVARLEHINIVPLYDFWRDPTGAYLVMRYLRGGTVRDSIEERGPWSLEDTQKMLSQIASALSLAHRNGVIHRDMKPANIMLDDEKNAYLTDFGIAKDIQTDNEVEEDLVGTPAYSAPEQITGERITPRTDIYGLGLIVYEMLTGQPAVGATSISEVIINQLNKPLPDIDTIVDVPSSINTVLQTATAKDPDDRYEDVLTFARDFKRALSEEGRQSSGVFNDGGFDDMIVISDDTISFTDESIIITGASAAVNPYKGLRAFQEGDADDFFGREDLTQMLLNRLQEEDANAHFLAIVGPSGSGKSSVVKAGVIPAVREGALPNSQNFFIAEMVPGVDVITEIETVLMSIAITPPQNLRKRLLATNTGLHDALVEILPDDGSDLFLLIDQFEEVFTQTEDNAARVHFMSSLQYAITHPQSRLWAVITIRADFYDKPLLYPEFGQLVRQRTEVVLPLSAAELQDAIVAPAQRSGVQVEPILVDSIVADVRDEPGALPLLQYALTELFERRTGRLMTLESYRESGGVLGSLARRAEELYTELQPAEQEAVRQLFLRLVTLGEGTEDTRRRVLYSELAFSDAENDPLRHVVETYTRYRLLTGDNDPQTREPTVEVAHEALIRQWQRLRNWLADNRENIRIQRRISALLNEWHRSGEDPSFLATGMRLRQFETLLTSSDIVLTDDETAYVKASIEKHEAAIREEEERQRRERELERRARSFLRALAMVMGLAFIVSGLLAVFALIQQGRAQREAVVNYSISLSNQARLLPRAGEEPLLGLSYAVEANSINNPPIEVQETLAEIAWQPGARRLLDGHRGWVWGTAYSPDGSMILSAGGSVDSSDDYSMILWDAATGDLLRRFEGHTDRVYSVTFSEDMTMAASASQDSSVIIWDLANGDILHRLGEGNNSGHAVDVWSVRFTRNDRELLSGDSQGHIIIWDVETGTILREYDAIHSGHVEDVDFANNGQLVLTGSVDNTVKIWEYETGNILGQYDTGAFVLGVRFLPDEQSVVSADFNGRIIHWDFENASVIRTIDIPGNTPLRGGLELSPDGNTVYAGDDLGNLLLYDLFGDSSEPAQIFAGHDRTISRMWLHPDGTELVTASFDETLIIWDLVGSGAQLQQFNDHDDWVLATILSPDGQRVIAGSEDGRLYAWDVDDPANRTEFVPNNTHGAITSLAISADGQQLASGAEDGTVILWNMEDASILRLMDGTPAPVRALAFDRAGNQLAAAGGFVQIGADRVSDNRILIWDVESGTITRELDAHTAAVRTLAFHPDEDELASGSDDTNILLWDLESNDQPRRLDDHTDSVWSLDYNSDGTRLVSGSRDTSIILWNLENGRSQVLAGHNTPVRAVAFSPDDAHVLSGAGSIESSGVGETYNLRYWDVESGQIVREFPGHTDVVRSIAFNEDGSLAVSGSHDTNVIVWQIQSLTELLEDIAANYDIICVPEATNNYCEGEIEEETDTESSNERGFPAQITSDEAYVQGSLCRLPADGSAPAMELMDMAAFRTEPPYTIGYSDSGITGTPHEWILAWAKYEAESREEIDMLRVLDAGGNPNRQIEDIEALLRGNIDLLIINPIERSNMTALEEKIAEVMQAGVPVILVGSRTNEPVYATYVGQDNYEVGCIMAQELVALADGEGDIVRVHGVNESPSDRRFKSGAEAVLSQFAAITLITEQATDFNRERAIELAEDNTTFTALAGILGYTGDLTLGVQEGLSRTERAFAPVVSDHYADLGRFILEQNLEGVLVRVPTRMGADAIDAAIAILNGESISQFIRIEPTLISSDELINLSLADAPPGSFIGDYVDLPQEFWPEASAE